MATHSRPTNPYAQPNLARQSATYVGPSGQTASSTGQLRSQSDVPPTPRAGQQPPSTAAGTTPVVKHKLGESWDPEWYRPERKHNYNMYGAAWAAGISAYEYAASRYGDREDAKSRYELHHDEAGGDPRDGPRGSSGSTIKSMKIGFGRKVNMKGSDFVKVSRAYESEWCDRASALPGSTGSVQFQNLIGRTYLAVPYSFKYDYANGLRVIWANPNGNYAITGNPQSPAGIDAGFNALWVDEQYFDNLFNYLEIESIETEVKCMPLEVVANTGTDPLSGLPQAANNSSTYNTDPGYFYHIPWSGDQQWLVSTPSTSAPNVQLNADYVNDSYLDGIQYRKKFSAAHDMMNREPIVHSMGIQPIQPVVIAATTPISDSVLEYMKTPAVDMYEYAGGFSNLSSYGGILIFKDPASGPNAVTGAVRWMMRFKIRVKWSFLLPPQINGTMKPLLDKDLFASYCEKICQLRQEAIEQQNEVIQSQIKQGDFAKATVVNGKLIKAPIMLKSTEPEWDSVSQHSNKQ